MSGRVGMSLLRFGKVCENSRLIFVMSYGIEVAILPQIRTSLQAASGPVTLVLHSQLLDMPKLTIFI